MREEDLEGEKKLFLGSGTQGENTQTPKYNEIIAMSIIVCSWNSFFIVMSRYGVYD